MSDARTIRIPLPAAQSGAASAAQAGAGAAPAGLVRDRLALGAFSAAVLIGGTNFVAVRFSNRELDPLWGAGFRFALAAAVFGLLVAALRLPLPRGRSLALVATYGLLAFAATYGLMYWAMQEIPAGIAAVVLAAVPLLTLLLAVAHGMERLSARALAGALVALAGSVVIFFQPGALAFGWKSFVALALGAICAAESVVVGKLAGRQHPVAMNFVAMSVGAAVLLAASALAGERFALPAGGETRLAVAYLVLASVGLFLCFLVVVQRWTASATSYVLVLMPVIAIGLGALLLGEPITATTVAGAAIVGAGVYVGAVRRR